MSDFLVTYLGRVLWKLGNSIETYAYLTAVASQVPGFHENQQKPMETRNISCHFTDVLYLTDLSFIYSKSSILQAQVHRGHHGAATDSLLYKLIKRNGRRADWYGASAPCRAVKAQHFFIFL
jgi:hypothetical protein